MLPESFLLNYVGFSADNAPIIDVQVGDELSRIEPLGRELSLEFDMTQRFCTGWLDFANHQALPCPDHAIVEGKYDQCITCRNKTASIKRKSRNPVTAMQLIATHHNHAFRTKTDKIANM